VLGAGSRKHPASAVAMALVHSVGGILQLSRATEQELAQVSGVNATRASRIVAAFELGRRALDQTVKREPVGRPEDIYRIVAPRVAGVAQEVFFVVGVDIRNGLIDCVEVARGSVIGVEVHPREVFRPLIRMAAAGGVLVHNHPSGDPTPSFDDIALTRRLREAGDTIGIPIIDHVVVAAHEFRSIAEYLGVDLDGLVASEASPESPTRKGPHRRRL
jgi:DNA repair protein RadC